MSDTVFTCHEGRLPLLVSVPHDGREVPGDIAVRMTPAGRALPDTDWHVARLYGFCRKFGASMLVARYSRYVVDLNRPPDDAALYPGQLSTGLCPARTFAGDTIYADGSQVDEAERERRRQRYWLPYHGEIRRRLDAIHARHGYALLWDAHSIPSRVPSLFDGELPVLNVGTDGGRSCAARIEAALVRVAKESDFPCVVNGRFRGGYITRRYGAPDENMHAVQLEIAQRAYMDEESLRYDDARAALLEATLVEMLDSLLRAAQDAQQEHERLKGVPHEDT